MNPFMSQQQQQMQRQQQQHQQSLRQYWWKRKQEESKQQQKLKDQFNKGLKNKSKLYFETYNDDFAHHNIPFKVPQRQRWGLKILLILIILAALFFLYVVFFGT